MKHPLYYLLIIVLLLPNFMSCKSTNKIHQDDIPVGKGEYFIKNDSYIYDSYHKDIRTKNLRSKDTYVSIEGAINIRPDSTRPESIHRYGSFARIEIKSINNKRFNIHDQSFNASPDGTIYLNNDGSISFKIKIDKVNFTYSELKTLPDEMKIQGSYIVLPIFRTTY